MFSTLVVLLALAGLSQGHLEDEYQNNLELHDSYTVYWTHNNSQSALNFAIKAKTSGWVAFGFANKIDQMKGYDVAVGYKTSPTVRVDLRDFHTDGHKPPVIDSKQNLEDPSGSEENGFTTLKFKRKLDTGDQNDIVIKPGPMLVVWSYSNVDDVTKKHTSRGYKTIILIPDSATAHAVSWVMLLTTSAFGYMMSYGVSF